MSSYQPRYYRNKMGGDRFDPIIVTYLETDLWIGLPHHSNKEIISRAAFDEIKRLRKLLDHYIKDHPQFLESMIPLDLTDEMPDIAKKMTLSSKTSGTGPMATVAGAFAEAIGSYLIARFGLEEIVVENGGDLFIVAKKRLSIPVFAGESPLSGRVGLEILPQETPCGVCTSAGTVGPSKSFGQADGVMVAATSALIADGWATALGNRIHSPKDIEGALALYREISDPIGLIIICGDQIGIRGRQLKIFKDE